MEQISNEALWGKLSEIEKKLSSNANKNQPTQLSIEPILDRLAEIEQILAKPSTLKHHHSIEIKSSKVFIALVSLSLFLLVAIVLNISQYRENNRLIDNDLKYRFVKAANQADSIKISELENIFEINRDEEAIGIIRERVETHERAVVKRAKALEQARWKEEEAERLKMEAKMLRE